MTRRKRAEVEAALTYLRLAADRLEAAGAPLAHLENLRAFVAIVAAEVAHGMYDREEERN